MRSRKVVLLFGCVWGCLGTDLVKEKNKKRRCCLETVNGSPSPSTPLRTEFVQM